MSALTPLEWLGVEVAAERLLCGNRGLGRLLSILIQAEGCVVPLTRLAEARVVQQDRDKSPERSARVRICLLRAALADVGLRGVITTKWGQGYAIPDPASILERLRLEAKP